MTQVALGAGSLGGGGVFARAAGPGARALFAAGDGDLPVYPLGSQKSWPLTQVGLGAGSSGGGGVFARAAGPGARALFAATSAAGWAGLSTPSGTSTVGNSSGSSARFS